MPNEVIASIHHIIGAPMHAYDAHTHLDHPSFDGDRTTVCDRARAAGLVGWLIAGVHPDDWDQVLAVAKQTGGAAALGIHPWALKSMSQQQVDTALSDLQRRKGHVAIGETGLDHFRMSDVSERKHQRDAFRSHLALAREQDLPVVLHVVRAMTEVLQICRVDGLPKAGGMVHRWEGKAPQVDLAVSLGLHISFGPGLLRPKASKLWECCRRVPSERLLFETDSPEQPLAGAERGEPADVVAVIAKAAAIKRTTTEELAAQTTQNAQALFRLSNRS